MEKGNTLLEGKMPYGKTPYGKTVHMETGCMETICMETGHRKTMHRKIMSRRAGRRAAALMLAAAVAWTAVPETAYAAGEYAGQYGMAYAAGLYVAQDGASSAAEWHAAQDGASSAAEWYAVQDGASSADGLYAVQQAEKPSSFVRNPRVGDDATTWDCIYFGSYWQYDNNGDGIIDERDSKEPIKWRVLEVDGDCMFLISDRLLDGHVYHNSDTDVGWASCSLRSWLNGEFFGNAFTKQERDAILYTSVDNSDYEYFNGSTWKHIDGGGDTVDKIFLLSAAEASDPAYGFGSVFDEDSTRRNADNTAYSREHGIYRVSGGSNGNGGWLLRSVGGAENKVSYIGVFGGGSRNHSVSSKDNQCGIRPAIRLPLSSKLYVYAGTVTSNDRCGTYSPQIHFSPITLPGHIMAEAGGTAVISGRVTMDFGVNVNVKKEDVAAAMSEIEWTSSNEASAVVTGCEVTDYYERTVCFQITVETKRSGEAIISGTRKGGYPVSCSVTVAGRLDTLDGITLAPPRKKDDVTTWDCVYFGNYWQNDNNGDRRADKSDAKEPIKWRVLSIENGEMLLLADKMLDTQKYHEAGGVVAWEDSDIRKWLNEYFLLEAFDGKERNDIAKSVIENAGVSGSQNASVDQGGITEDYVFLLSMDEAVEPAYGFFIKQDTGYDERASVHTAYSRAQGASGNAWMLRSICRTYDGDNSMTYISRYGRYGSQSISKAEGVRPVIRVKLSSKLYSYAGWVDGNGKMGEVPPRQEERQIWYTLGLEADKTAEEGGSISIEGSLTVDSNGDISYDGLSGEAESIVWSSSDSAVALVSGCTKNISSDGKTVKLILSVDAAGAGTAVITGTLSDGYTASCTVTVNKKQGGDNQGIPEPPTDGRPGAPRISGGVSIWDCVYFGSYWQNDTNGDGSADKNDSKEPIKWRVLSVEGGELLLIADMGLDALPYNDGSKSVTWETSTVRGWLNGEFLATAFDDKERTEIIMSDVINSDNQHYHTRGGNNTQDKIFLLSIEEASNTAYGFSAEYEKSCDARISVSTPYAAAQGAKRLAGGAGWWWLRSPGRWGNGAVVIYNYGDGVYNGYDVSRIMAVRPMLRIPASSELYTYAGTASSEETPGTPPGSKPPVNPVEPTQPTTQKPTQPTTEKPTQPTTERPTQPTTEEPTQPTTEKPTQPTTEEPTQPTTEKPTQPTTEEPTQPTTEETTTQEASEDIDFEYTYPRRGNGYVITKYIGTATEVVVPSTIKGEPVIEVRNAFDQNTSVTSVTISEGIRLLSDNVFSGCTALTEVKLPDSLTEIAGNVFTGCTALAEIKLPDNVETLSGNVFSRCTALTKIELPDGLVTISGGVFYGCSGLTSITIPSSVRKIEKAPFERCDNLKEIIIEDGIEAIGTGAFQKCPGLVSIIIPDSVKEIGSSVFWECTSLESVTIGNNVTIIDDYAFYKCKSLLGITIPDSVTKIGTSAFGRCSALKNAVIGNGVKTIGENAFETCESMTGIVIGNSVTDIGKRAFSECSSLEGVIIPDSVENIGDHAFSECTKLKDAVIGNGVREITPYMFIQCTSLGSVTIGTGVTDIGEFAFAYCGSLKSLTIPGNVKSIGVRAFTYCGSIGDLILAEGLETIGIGAFEYCKSVKKVTVPDSVTMIYGAAFSNCVSLTNVKLPEGLDIIDTSTFADCSGLKSINIPVSVKTIGETAFIRCTSLENVTLPDGLKEIGANAFAACTSMTSVKIPDSVEALGSSAFSGCSGITELKLGKNLPQIERYAFFGCSALPGVVVIPDGVKFIDEYAFSGCASIEGLIISNSVESTGKGSFADCTSLKSVDFGSGIKIVGWRSFEKCETLEEINLPDSVEAIEYGAFMGCRMIGKVTFGNRLENIDGYAFSGCSNIKIFDFPESLKEIGYNAFYGCQGLLSVKLPDGLEKLARGAIESAPIGPKDVVVTYKGNHYTAETLTDLYDLFE